MDTIINFQVFKKGGKFLKEPSCCSLHKKKLFRGVSSSLFSCSSPLGSGILLNAPLTNIIPHLSLRNEKVG
jgi:hypothetical protein